MLSREDLVASLPDTTSDVTVTGLSGPVTIHRDQWGIAHVQAECVGDAAFGQGFACAQDRLWHMDADRHRAEGRWAELAGQPGLSSDMFFCRLHLALAARRTWQSLDPAARDTFSAYAAGVSSFIATTNSLPVEYRLVGYQPRLWQPWDCILVFWFRHVMMGSWTLKMTRARLCHHLGPEMAAYLMADPQPDFPLVTASGAWPPDQAMVNAMLDAEACLPGEAWTAIAGGSNNWALTGSRTPSGLPLLGGDPHRQLEVPGTYYPNYLACPDFDAAGFSFPGVPGFPHFGRNRQVAWCITHAGSDDQDLYVERFSDQGRTYLCPEGWLPTDITVQEIQVRGSSPVKVTTYGTRHGPVICGDPGLGWAVTLCWAPLFSPDTTGNCLLPMLKAGSVSELHQAMVDWVDPGNNLLAADRDTIGYRLRGRLPMRKRQNGYLPVPGWTDQHDWRGFVPFAEMPVMMNPERGFIVTANNRIVGGDYPHFIAAQFAPATRARRLTELLAGTERLSPDDVTRLHTDHVSTPAREFCQQLADLHLPDHLATFQAQLLDWDGAMSSDRIEPTLYCRIRDQLTESILLPRLGPLCSLFRAGDRGLVRVFGTTRSRLVEMIRSDDRTLLPQETDWPSALESAFAAAVRALCLQFGTDTLAWKWGKVHRTRPVHALTPSFPHLADILEPGPVPTAGDQDCVRATGYLPHCPGFAAAAGPVARYLLSPDGEGNGWIAPPGVSGHPASPHFSDQLGLWSRGELLTIPKGGTEAPVSVQRLVPKNLVRPSPPKG